MKYIAVLGSTGSIGKSTLEVIRAHSDKFKVIALSTNSDIDTLYRQIKLFQPKLVCIKDVKAAARLKSRINLKGIRFFTGEEGLKEMPGDKRIDKVVLAVSGAAALLPLLKAIENGKDIALANKEALVMAGSIIMNKASAHKVKIIPIDSEQSAIWQCLRFEDKNKLKNIYLTASGGPLLKTNKKYFKDISAKQVLKHPRWRMGPKITVDSATLMNKGLEVLEAMHLFGVAPEKIKVLIHPQALVHSMVEFIDGVVLAQLSATDMRIPIQYALTYPQRLSSKLTNIDFCAVKNLSFQRPDFSKFPCLELAYKAAREGGTIPAVLNAANEVGVEQFLKHKINFVSIPKVIARICSRHRNITAPRLTDILNADAWARREAAQVIYNLG
ncbi:MAG: 1-deoxy-D-xylulose-5-phosphate reductoisomerase [Candidatus Omnitrophica bacterium]|nr:1-deoxy-D-xylulose-5-phosphate reductoisomerase [Candidatus Omnitrophota bacterium]MDD5592394.1 1-deoxy-D-xylulose-5-phosphate reductoisomerase [Candidatus Omnitrophota bacterium]